MKHHLKKIFQNRFFKTDRKSQSSTVVLDLEEGERLNKIGMLYLARQKFSKAEQYFQSAIIAAPMIPAAHNNLALAMFIQGRIDDAVRIQKNILKRVPVDNIFGLCNLVHFYLTIGRTKDATAMADKTLRMEPQYAEVLVKQCEALARLNRHQDILNIVERYEGELDGAVYYFTGIAAANLGLFERALDDLKRVRLRDGRKSKAIETIRLIKAGRGPGTIEGNWPYFEAQDIVPREVFENLLREEAGNRSGKSALLQSPVILDFLIAMLNKNLASKGEDLVEIIGQMKHPRANGLLKQIVEGTFGSDEIRLCAFRILLDKGVLDRNSSHKIWVRGKWTEVKAQQLDVTSEAESAPLPTGLDGLYDDALRATHRHRWSEGERLWRKIIAQAPAFHPAYYNLAVVLIRQEKTDEAETCLRKALEIDPGYIFAPCTLAILCLGKGRTAEAQSLLDAVIIPEKVHPSAMAAYCCAQAQVSAAKNDKESVRRWLDLGTNADPDNPSVKELRKHFRIR